jgi:hypothetical protein
MTRHLERTLDILDGIEVIGDGDDNVASSLKINYRLKNWQIFTVLSKGQEDNLYNYVECGMVYMFKPKN